jgi:hypothetical protein
MPGGDIDIPFPKDLGDPMNANQSPARELSGWLRIPRSFYNKSVNSLV